MDLEFHQLDLRYEELRGRSPARERRLLSSLMEVGQQVPIVVVCAPPVRIPLDLGSHSARIWAPVPERLGAIGAQRRDPSSSGLGAAPLGARGRLDDQPLLFCVLPSDPFTFLIEP
jgi:hypothetical protein